ncbi:MAG: Rossmann-like and DUF2520 domain-containing protein [Chitinophagales bacterium]
MTFSIIGTGNIAWFFGNRLVTGRHHCTGVYARNKMAAKELAEALLSDKFGEPGEVRDGDADICFLAVSDVAIGQIAAKLSFKKTMLVHTAGAVGLESISSAAKDRAVLWPVYSILRNNQPAHRKIPCAWEASSPKARQYILSIGHAITDQLFEAKYEQRKWLHLAAVMSNNFITHLMAICEQICADNNLPFSTLLPIIEQTFERIKNTSAQQVQTGPAIRHDTTTIKEQMALLSNHPHWQKVYEAITNSIQNNTPNP